MNTKISKLITMLHTTPYKCRRYLKTQYIGLWPNAIELSTHKYNWPKKQDFLKP